MVCECDWTIGRGAAYYPSQSLLRVMTMALGWILKRLAGTQSTGLFAYLTSRDQNKSRIELERARIVGTKELIEHLPDGAVYREGTPYGWREIQMPSVRQPPLFALPVEQQTSAKDPSESVELPHPPMALGQIERSESLDASPPLDP
jgi:hypothetical protein